MRNRKSPVCLAAIKTSNMVAELNIQQTGGAGAGGGSGNRSAPAGFWACQPFSLKKKKKESEGQSLSEVILRIERVLHENQSVNQGQLRAGMWSRVRRRTPPTRTRAPRVPSPHPAAAAMSWGHRELPAASLGQLAGAGAEDAGPPPHPAPRAAPLELEVGGPGRPQAEAGPTWRPAPRAPAAPRAPCGPRRPDPRGHSREASAGHRLATASCAANPAPRCAAPGSPAGPARRFVSPRPRGPRRSLSSVHRRRLRSRSAPRSLRGAVAAHGRRASQRGGGASQLRKRPPSPDTRLCPLPPICGEPSRQNRRPAAERGAAGPPRTQKAAQRGVSGRCPLCPRARPSRPPVPSEPPAARTRLAPAACGEWVSVCAFPSPG